MFRGNRITQIPLRALRSLQWQLRPFKYPQLQLRRYASGGSALQGWATILSTVAYAYVGGLIICGGSLYLLYKDATSRQNIPFELGVDNTILTIKAIGKDDVLESPRYAVKHYRRLLIDLAKKENPNLIFEETTADGERNYSIPLISADVLLHSKSAAFANFYVDIVLRYARALLSKGNMKESVEILKGIVEDDLIFYSVGDPEKMSQCCRTLSKVTADQQEQFKYLEKSVKMLTETFKNVSVDENYLLTENSKLTDELLLSLNGLAFAHARSAESMPSKQKMNELNKALNIYLANLKALTYIKDRIESRELTQASFPLINCDLDNLTMSIAEIKAHVSEILWARGNKESAIAWGEELVHDIFFENARVARASPVLDDVLKNLTTMYTKLRRPEDVERCQNLRNELVFFEKGKLPWYDSLIKRFTRIIYYKGPLGVIEKAIKERFGPTQYLPDVEEYENEDEE